jgi:23S rRNA-/tRNA-specific pseudouridylate synthase
MFLHAASIGLKHPASGAKLVIEAPLPADLQKFVDKLD